MQQKMKPKGRRAKLGKSIKYLGSKSAVLPSIMKAVEHVPHETVLDLFAGSGRVAHAFHCLGSKVVANDYLVAAATVTQGLLSPQPEARYYEEMAKASPVPMNHWWCDAAEGYITRENAAAIGGMRLYVDTVPPEARAALLGTLMVALGRVDACVGQYAAHLHGDSVPARTKMDVRTLIEPLQHAPDMPAGKVACSEAQALVDSLPDDFHVDLVYLDPPYTPTVNYPRYYHLLDTLVLFDAPVTRGKTKKRPNTHEKSPWISSKAHAVEEALIKLMVGLQGHTSHVLLSFSDESTLSKDRLVQILLEHGGSVIAHEHRHPAHVGKRADLRKRPYVAEYLFHVRMRGRSLAT